MKKTAFSTWENRIAPVFDIARQILLVESDSDRILGERQETLPEDPPVQKAMTLAELGIGTLVCGAITKPLREVVAAYGIEVIPFVAGDLREVVQAWLSGSLESDAYAMPGCYGSGHRGFRGMSSGVLAGGSGRGKRRGARDRHRLGRPGGFTMAGSAGVCVCPNCGQREIHELGVACFEQKCPKCGTTMNRE